MVTDVLGFRVSRAPSANSICAKLSRSVVSVSPLSILDFCDSSRAVPSAFFTDSVPDRRVTVPVEAAAPPLASARGRSSTAPARGFTVLLRQDDRVAQHDTRAAHLDVAAHLQVLHDAAHHPAR